MSSLVSYLSSILLISRLLQSTATEITGEYTWKDAGASSVIVSQTSVNENTLILGVTWGDGSPLGVGTYDSNTKTGTMDLGGVAYVLSFDPIFGIIDFTNARWMKTDISDIEQDILGYYEAEDRLLVVSPTGVNGLVATWADGTAIGVGTYDPNTKTGTMTYDAIPYAFSYDAIFGKLDFGGGEWIKSDIAGKYTVPLVISRRNDNNGNNIFIDMSLTPYGSAVGTYSDPVNLDGNGVYYGILAMTYANGNEYIGHYYPLDYTIQIYSTDNTHLGAWTKDDRHLIVDKISCSIADSYARDTATPICPAGYSSYTGLDCIEDCPSGYTDIGFFCVSVGQCNDCHEECDWAPPPIDEICEDVCDLVPCNTITKDITVGTASCPSGYEYYGVTCLQNCVDDYIQAALLCVCDVVGYVTDVVDFMHNIQSQDFVTVLANALLPVVNIDPQLLYTTFMTGGQAAIDVIAPYLDDIKLFFHLFEQIFYSNRRRLSSASASDRGVVIIEFAASVHAGYGGSAALGVVRQTSTGLIYFYLSACYGYISDLEASTSVSAVVMDDINSVPGQATVYNVGLDLGFMVNGAADVFCVGEWDGYGMSIGIGVGIAPAEIGVHQCITTDLSPGQSMN